MTHRHQCCQCGSDWVCDSMEGKKRGQKPWKDRPSAKCGITIAAGINGNGTWCKPCRRSEMRSRRRALRFSLFALFAFFAVNSHALTLAWDPSPGTNIAGYKIWYGTSHSIYTGAFDVGDTLHATRPLTVMIYRAISLHQPRAHYMATGLKKNETRSWPTKYRGLLAIHAAKRPVKLRETERFDGLFDMPDQFTYGAILAIVNVYDVKTTDEIRPTITSLDGHGSVCAGTPEYFLGNYDPGRFAWLTRDCQPLATPFPCLGRQGFFFIDIPDSHLTP